MTDEPTLPSVVRPNLNLAEDVAERERAGQTSAPRHPDPIQPTRLVSIDIESLGLGPRPVITEIAMLGYDLEDDSLMDARHVHFYPVEPQQRIMPPREIHFSTIVWWMGQPEEVRSRLKQSTATEFEDLASLCRNLVTVFNQITNHGKANYEVIAAHPEFDIVAIQTLLQEVGLETPWDFRSVIDVRTMLKRAGINHKNVPKPAGVIPHTAYGDARWQINQYLAAVRGVAAA